MTRPGYYSRKFRELRKAWGGACVQCGSKRKLEFAHLPGKPTGLNGRGRGQSQRYRDIRSHPDCYVLLCSKDHRLLDGRHWNYPDHQEEQQED